MGGICPRQAKFGFDNPATVCRGNTEKIGAGSPAFPLATVRTMSGFFRIFGWFYNMLRYLLLSLLFLITPKPLLADEPTRIAILSYRSQEQTQQQWQPLADYLSREIPGRRFEIVPAYFQGIKALVEAKQVDFVFLNPELYQILIQSSGISALATLMPLVDGHPVDRFGGVVFTRSDRGDLQNLTDLKDKTIAATSKESFGGFIMQQWELYKKDIRPAGYVYTGMPHDNVVEAVMEGRVDAGFVRTGIIEALTEEGKLSPHALRVINPQRFQGFPLFCSTALYPEWAFAALPETDPSLKKAVSLALLNLNDHAEVAKALNIFGFSPPGDYSLVEGVMLRLNMHPQELKNINALDFYYRYRHSIWLASLLTVVIGLLSVKLFRIHRRLRRTALKYHLVADNTYDWIFWMAPDGNVAYMSPSCERVTGYEPLAFMRDPALLEKLVHPEDRAAYRRHWDEHHRYERSGDIEFRIIDKAGNILWIHHLCQPVYNDKNVYQGIRASNRDITARKKIELELSLHDAALQACADAIVITDVEATIQWINPAFSRLTGYSEQEALGRKPSELVKSGEQDGEFYKTLWETILAGQCWRGEIVNRRKSGELYHEQISITPLFGRNNTVAHFVAVKQDITERKAAEAKIRAMAFYDPLTHLANRRLLLNRLEHAMMGCRRTRQYGAVLFLDLDHFKPLNDQYGHDLGDYLLQQVAERLKSQVRQQDTVSRLGGDEFVVLLAELAEDKELAAELAQQIAAKILRTLGQSYRLNIGGNTLPSESVDWGLTVSIGISLFWDDDQKGEEVLKRADAAMYEAKHAGRNGIRLSPA